MWSLAETKRWTDYGFRMDSHLPEPQPWAWEVAFLGKKKSSVLQSLGSQIYALSD